MTSILRRLPLTRLLLLCATVALAGAGATAVAFALGAGPVPRPEGLAQAIHGALEAQPVQGVSATIQYTDRLLEGASLAGSPNGSGSLASSPLLQGASGRLWISADGQARLELEAGGGDTEVVLDHNTVSIYGAAPNTVYRYTLPGRRTDATEAYKAAMREATEADPAGGVLLVYERPDRHHWDAARHEPPTVAQIETEIAHAERDATISGAEPTDVAGQAAYSVTISPKEQGSLLGAVELAWDAVHGVPLRAAVYSTESTSPVIELAVSEVTYGPVESSVFEISPSPGSTVTELGAAKTHSGAAASVAGGGKPGRAEHNRGKITKYGQGLSTLVVDESTEASSGRTGSTPLGGLPTVSINGSTASELATALGTILSFERAGVRYIVAGAVKPAAVEAVARGL
jgi:outer membrane lipoprotein-sorting protein